MKKQPHKRGQKRCIFCGGCGMSKEHLWSDWMDELFQKNPQTNRRVRGEMLSRVLPSGITGFIEEPKISLQPGHNTTLQVRVVCRSCNHGWMDGLERAARPHLTQLITGSADKLSPEAQTHIARWIAMKIIVAEFLDRKTAGISQEQREYLYRHKEVPPGFWIWISPFSGAATSTFYHGSAFVGALQDDPPGGAVYNTQASVWSIGRLIAVIFSTANLNLTLDLSAGINQRMFRVWPSTKIKLGWRLGYAITDADANELTKLLHRTLVVSPDIKFREE